MLRFLSASLVVYHCKFPHFASAQHVTRLGSVTQLTQQCTMSTTSTTPPGTNANASSAEQVNEFSHPRWENMWKSGLRPGQAFDILTPSPVLVKYLEEGLVPEGRALVPGCGRGYDVTLLASERRSVLGLDIAETAVAAARERAAALHAGTYSPHEHEALVTVAANGVQRAHYQPQTSFAHPAQAQFSSENFFSLSPASDEDKFDFIYDYTFLCALHPSLRPQWARKMGELVRPGGELLTVIFPVVRDEQTRGPLEGPPYRVSLQLYRELLCAEDAGFECLELRELPPELSHPGRDGGADGKGLFSGVGRWRKK